jgi:hypothetical protein
MDYAQNCDSYAYTSTSFGLKELGLQKRKRKKDMKVDIQEMGCDEGR